MSDANSQASSLVDANSQASSFQDPAFEKSFIEQAKKNILEKFSQTIAKEYSAANDYLENKMLIILPKFTSERTRYIIGENISSEGPMPFALWIHSAKAIDNIRRQESTDTLRRGFIKCVIETLQNDVSFLASLEADLKLNKGLCAPIDFLLSYSTLNQLYEEIKNNPSAFQDLEAYIDLFHSFLSNDEFRKREEFIINVQSMRKVADRFIVFFTVVMKASLSEQKVLNDVEKRVCSTLMDFLQPSDDVANQIAEFRGRIANSANDDLTDPTEDFATRIEDLTNRIEGLPKRIDVLFEDKTLAQLYEGIKSLKLFQNDHQDNPLGKTFMEFLEQANLVNKAIEVLFSREALTQLHEAIEKNNQTAIISEGINFLKKTICNIPVSLKYGKNLKSFLDEKLDEKLSQLNSNPSLRLTP